MARFLESEDRRYEVLAMSREEAGALVRDLTNLLLFSRGAAPSLEMNESGCRVYQILFQVDSKPVDKPGITEAVEDSGPVFLRGIYEEEQDR